MPACCVLLSLWANLRCVCQTETKISLRKTNQTVYFVCHPKFCHVLQVSSMCVACVPHVCHTWVARGEGQHAHMVFETIGHNYRSSCEGQRARMVFERNFAFVQHGEFVFHAGHKVGQAASAQGLLVRLHTCPCTCLKHMSMPHVCSKAHWVRAYFFKKHDFYSCIIILWL